MWNIGEAHRNEIYYNPFGDILVTCGFGNISSGKMNFWNVEKRTEIIEHEVRRFIYVTCFQYMCA